MTAAHVPEDTRETPEETAPCPDGELTSERAAAAMAVAVVFIVLTAIAIRSTEMVTGRLVSHGVPPLPALAVLLTLSLVRPALRRRAPRWAPTQAQLLLIYIMLSVATILSGPYQIRAFLPHLVSLQYWGKDGGMLGRYASYLPAWYAPRDPEAIRRYFEGSRDGAIPWRFWLAPLFWWTLFLAAIFVCVHSMVALVRKVWIRHERLTFPLLSIPLAVTTTDWSAFGGKRQRRAVFVCGLAAAAAFNCINILHVLVPWIPSPGFYLSLQEYFPNRPWTPLGSVTLIFFLEAIGIGYFMPLEVTFSIWFFYLLNRAAAVAGMAMGQDAPGFPFTQEQAAGGYLAMGLILLWSLRRAWAASLRSSFGATRRTPEESEERRAWIGLGGGTLFLLAFCWKAGFSLTLAAPFLAILAVFTLVFARIRAETGVPFSFIYPYGLPKEMLINTFGMQNALAWGGTGSLVLFSSMAWLSRHHIAEEMAAYQMDGAKLADTARIPRRTLLIALAVATLVGVLCAYWVHLSAYYAIGSNMAGGGNGQGEFRATVALQEYQQMASRIAGPPAPQMGRFWGTFGGFCLVGLISLIRSRWVGLPLHPLGFLIATSYGDSCSCWFPLTIAWACKATLLRMGGLPMYRRGMPFFLGLTIGHFVMAGILWPVLSLFLAPEVSNAYHLYFGG